MEVIKFVKLLSRQHDSAALVLYRIGRGEGARAAGAFGRRSFKKLKQFDFCAAFAWELTGLELG